MKCEQCGKEFDTEQGLEQHKRDKHGETSHDIKEMKKKAKEEWKEIERKKAHGAKRQKNMLLIAGGAALVLALGFIVFMYKPAGAPPSTSYNLTGIPAHFVHWHADVDMVICGEEKQLPYGPAGSMLGTSRLHTHDRASNIASMASSDGNGVIHTEGNIITAPSEHTLGRFMKILGVKFSETEIMDKKNGDLCGDAAGSVKVFLNDAPLTDAVNYLPRDKDVIRIEFSAGNATST
ncbi:MAG: hypothetical protein HYY37_05370 [Candidatus Aenigmarchaeota archaeon]|nr:hypothetical protein [Candidatus Aenigmarchaeota archaeon]